MTLQDIDRIECAIRHIQTAVDVDPWAVEIAVEAMEKEISALQAQDSPKPKAESVQNVQNEDLISRKAAIDVLATMQGLCTSKAALVQNSKIWQQIKDLPSAQPNLQPTCNELATDTISRQDAIDALMDFDKKLRKINWYQYPHTEYECRGVDEAIVKIENVPSAQTEPLSDAYTKAVWTWLLDYQIKAAELKGRYTPYEVLSWVANDWRKEHERSDQQTGGD